MLHVYLLMTCFYARNRGTNEMEGAQTAQKKSKLHTVTSITGDNIKFITLKTIESRLKEHEFEYYDLVN